MAEFVLGTVQLGLAYGAANRTGKPSFEAALALVRAALSAGIGCFDTAQAYGDAEARLGAALAGHRARIVTKLSPLSDLGDEADLQSVTRQVDASITQSFEALGLTELSCLLLHRATHLSQWGGVVWDRLRSWKMLGQIERLGVSVQSPAEAEMALGFSDVEHIQLPYNLLDWRWSGVFERLKRRPEVTVHVRSAFLQGLLASGDPAVWPQIEGVKSTALLTVLECLARDLEREDVADLCLAYVRGHEAIDGVVIGLETEAQLQRNLELFARPPLSAAECLQVQSRLPRLPEQLLNPALWPKQ